MKLKVCGMKYYDNIQAVAALQPDYLGFIFYEKSPRFFSSEIPSLSDQTKKVGVFVNSTIEYILEKTKQYGLSLIQLHGSETPQYCQELAGLIDNHIQLIKVFSIKDHFDFNCLKAYEHVCDFFLFDTKGAQPGGNGYTFDWAVLENYPSTTPFFLSGGIGLKQIDDLINFNKLEVSKYCHAIDVNSQFEIKPGLKNIESIKKIITL